MNVLFAASEAYPLVKTGGLGDVLYSLPKALHARGADIRLVLPGYRNLLRQLDAVRIVGWLEVRGDKRTLGVRVLETRHAAYPFPIWVIDCPELFDRTGNPYVGADGRDWPDNAERFAVFARTVSLLAEDAADLGWRPDVVHAHDWQTGLVPAFLADLAAPPRTVFTIHNLAYGGYFPHGNFMRLQLPAHWWQPEGAEFHGSLSMLKAGIVYADAVTTVSPTYAEEICTPEFGCGLDGLLRSRRHKLSGILNGIDTDAWNPATDPHLPAHYSKARIQPGKRHNKRALLQRFQPVDDDLLDAPLLGLVGRLVEQKGIDWILAALPVLLAETDMRFVALGSGQALYEQKLQRLAQRHPDRVMVEIGYDEELAHRIEAGADLFLMPSRFEPCGLNQMYSLRYGTPPVVFRTGGLADTVVDADALHRADGSATGFVFDQPEVAGFVDAIRRGLDLYRQPKAWRRLQQTGMRQNFDWSESAGQYLSLYTT
ncbi:MAG: glycogen synthase GlgA [Gammaproteobacteria bacterium]